MSSFRTGVPNQDLFYSCLNLCHSLFFYSRIYIYVELYEGSLRHIAISLTHRRNIFNLYVNEGKPRVRLEPTFTTCSK